MEIDTDQEAPHPPIEIDDDLNHSQSHMAGENEVEAPVKPSKELSQEGGGRKRGSSGEATDAPTGGLKKRGRPKGSKNASTMLQEAIKNNFTKLAKQRSRKIFEKLTEEAIAGEPWAIKLFMDKIIPNASNEVEQKVKDFGIQIVINDMKSVESTENRVIEGEIEK